MGLFTSKKQLRKIIKELEDLVDQLEVRNSDLFDEMESLECDLDSFKENFPLDLGEVVYDVQLRSANGRYTKTKACREHSLINEVVVDKKNYFNLVERYHNNDVFLTRDEAVDFLDSVCID